MELKSKLSKLLLASSELDELINAGPFQSPETIYKATAKVIAAIHTVVPADHTFIKDAKIEADKAKGLSFGSHKSMALSGLKSVLEAVIHEVQTDLELEHQISTKPSAHPPNPVAASEITNRRYGVFVSSTYIDLKEERQHVMQTLLRKNCFPLGMELFPSANEDSWKVIEREIDNCDYYLLIVGSRYGSQIKKMGGISWTEREWEYAAAINKPRIAFVIGDQVRVQPTTEKPAAQKKLKDFKRKVQGVLQTSRWQNKDELANECSIALDSLKQHFPQPGWVRGDIVNQLLSQAKGENYVPDPLAWAIYKNFQINGFSEHTNIPDNSDGSWQAANHIQDWVGIDIRNVNLIQAWKLWYDRLLQCITKSLQSLVPEKQGADVVHLLITRSGEIKCTSQEESSEIKRGIPKDARTLDNERIKAIKQVCSALGGESELHFPSGTSIEIIFLQLHLLVGSKVGFESDPDHYIC
jgi:hypothetical protein